MEVLISAEFSLSYSVAFYRRNFKVGSNVFIYIATSWRDVIARSLALQITPIASANTVIIHYAVPL